MQALFIVFEGLDGSGTSTQSYRLESAWRARGRPCTITSEPSSGPIGQMIRQSFKGRLKFQESAELFDRQMAYLFAADRFDHLHNDVDGVIPLIKRGVSVISTRYIPSSFAYHCRNDVDWEVVTRLNQDFPAPDLLIYLRNPVEESVRRLQSRANLDSYENATKLGLAARNYDRYMQAYSGRKVILDARKPVEEVHLDVLEAVSRIV
jgi:dTMP kinase